MTERWLPVPGHEGIYEVSDQGRVKRVAGGQGARAGHILRIQTNRYGYSHVRLTENGRRYTYTVHRLVAAAFIGPRLSDLDVNHINGVKTDNRLVNLEYVTTSENLFHAYKFGLKRGLHGERNPHTSLKLEQVLRVRAMAHAGMPQTEIARQFGVSKSAINHIVHRRSWAHIPKLEEESETEDAALVETG